MNYIQFQEKFGSEAKIVQHFIHIRYKDKPCCNHCGSPKVYQRPDRPRIFQCITCENNFSIFKGTIFEKSTTDLRKWFYAIHLFLNGKKGISGLQLMREVDVTYKTAWRMLRHIRMAMANTDFKDCFDDVVEVDETYVGGKPRKGPNGMTDLTSKRGRGTDKVPVVGIKDRTNSKVYARVVLPDDKKKQLTAKQLIGLIKEVVKKDAIVMTDEYKGYYYLDRHGYNHLTINHSKQFSTGAIHTNGIESFWGTLKRGVYGIYHMVSPKYLQSYIDEFCFRYNNRDNPNVFDLVLLNAIKQKNVVRV